MSVRNESQPDLYEVLRETGNSPDADLYFGKLWKRAEKRPLGPEFYTKSHTNRRYRGKAAKEFFTSSTLPYSSRPGVDLKVSYKTRSHLFARDRGCCALCGFDCLALMVAITFVKHRIERDSLGFDCIFREFLWAVGPRAKKYPQFLCEIDHIQPRSQGGKDDLDNLRLLCLVCHDKETKRLIYGWT